MNLSCNYDVKLAVHVVLSVEVKAHGSIYYRLTLLAYSSGELKKVYFLKTTVAIVLKSPDFSLIFQVLP